MLRNIGAVKVNKRVHPSNSYINSYVTLCLCMGACCPRVRTSICLSGPGPIFKRVSYVSRVGARLSNSGRCSLFIAYSMDTESELTVTNPCFSATGEATYVSRRVDGSKFTRIGRVEKRMDSTYRILCKLFSPRGIIHAVTIPVCAKVIRSAKMFRCSSASPRAVHVTKRLVGAKFGFDGVVSRSFCRGACIRGRMVKHILTRDVLLLSKGYVVKCLGGESVRFCNISNGSLSNVIDRLHLATKIRITVFVCRIRARSFGISLHSGKGISMDGVTMCFNNNNRVETTKYSLRNSICSIVGGIARRVYGRFRRRRI